MFDAGRIRQIAGRDALSQLGSTGNITDDIYEEEIKVYNLIDGQSGIEAKKQKAIDLGAKYTNDYNAAVNSKATSLKNIESLIEGINIVNNYIKGAANIADAKENFEKLKKISICYSFLPDNISIGFDSFQIDGQNVSTEIAVQKILDTLLAVKNKNEEKLPGFDRDISFNDEIKSYCLDIYIYLNKNNKMPDRPTSDASRLPEKAEEAPIPKPLQKNRFVYSEFKDRLDKRLLSQIQTAESGIKIWTCKSNGYEIRYELTGDGTLTKKRRPAESKKSYIEMAKIQDKRLVSVYKNSPALLAGGTNRPSRVTAPSPAPVSSIPRAREIKDSEKEEPVSRAPEVLDRRGPKENTVFVAENVMWGGDPTTVYQEIFRNEKTGQDEGGKYYTYDDNDEKVYGQYDSVRKTFHAGGAAGRPETPEDKTDKYSPLYRAALNKARESGVPQYAEYKVYLSVCDSKDLPLNEIYLTYENKSHERLTAQVKKDGDKLIVSTFKTKNDRVIEAIKTEEYTLTKDQFGTQTLAKKTGDKKEEVIIAYNYKNKSSYMLSKTKFDEENAKWGKYFDEEKNKHTAYSTAFNNGKRVIYLPNNGPVLELKLENGKLLANTYKNGVFVSQTEIKEEKPVIAQAPPQPAQAPKATPAPSAPAVAPTRKEPDKQAAAEKTTPAKKPAAVKEPDSFRQWKYTSGYSSIKDEYGKLHKEYTDNILTLSKTQLNNLLGRIKAWSVKTEKFIEEAKKTREYININNVNPNDPRSDPMLKEVKIMLDYLGQCREQIDLDQSNIKLLRNQRR